jgi:CRP-like cAMP-binding protein
MTSRLPPPSRRKAPAPQLETVSFNTGDILFEAGDAPDKAYLIQSGQILITALQDGEEIVIAHAGPGEFVGELALVNVGPRSATAIAQEPTTCVVITQAIVDRIMARADVVTAALIRLLAKRLRAMTARVSEP